jgi:hypothetical protein
MRPPLETGVLAAAKLQGRRGRHEQRRRDRHCRGLAHANLTAALIPMAGLLTGGLQVQVLSEEPILSITYTAELSQLHHISPQTSPQVRREPCAAAAAGCRRQPRIVAHHLSATSRQSLHYRRHVIACAQRSWTVQEVSVRRPCVRLRGSAAPGGPARSSSARHHRGAGHHDGSGEATERAS